MGGLDAGMRLGAACEDGGIIQNRISSVTKLYVWTDHFLGDVDFRICRRTDGKPVGMWDVVMRERYLWMCAM